MYYINRNAKLMLSRQHTNYSLEVKKEEPPKSVEAQIGEGLELKHLLRKTIKELNKAREDPVEELRQIIKPQLPKPIKIRTDGSRLSRKGDGLSLTSRNRQVVTLERKYGKELIKGFKICRKPIHKGIRKVLQLLTLNKIKEIEQEMDYAEAYHLFLYVDLANGKTFKIHKNAVVDVEYTKSVPKGSQCVSKHVEPKYSVSEMIVKAEQFNKQLYKYNATQYNCQNFIMSLLKPIGYWDNHISEFTMQDFSDLFTPATGAIAQGITNMAGLFNRMIGRGLNLPTGGNGLELPSGGDGLKLAGTESKLKKPDPLEKLRGKVAGQGLNLPTGTGGNGAKPDKKLLNKILKEHLMDELKLNHPHLDVKNVKKIVTNFKLHKDEKTLPEHGKHLAGQLIKHYFKGKQMGSGILDELKIKVGKVIFNAIKYYLETGRKQAGSGKRLKKLGAFFKKAGKFLLDHRKEIAKGVKKAADVGAIIATAAGQPELAAPLKTVATIAGAVEKI